MRYLRDNWGSFKSSLPLLTFPYLITAFLRETQQERTNKSQLFTQNNMGYQGVMINIYNYRRISICKIRFIALYLKIMKVSRNYCIGYVEQIK